MGAEVIGVVVIVRRILTYLGWNGVVLGVIALVFGSTRSASALAIGGMEFIALSYLLGGASLALSWLRKPQHVHQSSQPAMTTIRIAIETKGL